MGENIKNYFIARNILTFLDIALAILIIVFASDLITTPLGRSAITFGLVMLAITTILKVLQKW